MRKKWHLEFSALALFLSHNKNYRGRRAATIFSLSQPVMEDLMSEAQWLVGEDPRKEEANGRGRTGSCRRPADHGRGDLL